MEDKEDGSDLGLRLLLAGVLLLSVVGGGIDLALDSPESFWSFHAIYEVVLILASLAAFILVWRAWFRARHELADVRGELTKNQAERDAWRASAQSALAGFGKAIEKRFISWGLTPTESEVALNLLKGRSHKEIAYATGRSERTIRQHAVSVYQKSGLRGRAEFAAFFLDDVMLPQVTEDHERIAPLEALPGPAAPTDQVPTSRQPATPKPARSPE